MRKLLMIPELAKKYNITEMNVMYYPKHNDALPINKMYNKLPYYKIPISLDVLIKNKVWIAYDDENDTIITPDYLIGVGNHWIQVLRDDHKNRRIDISEYLLK